VKFQPQYCQVQIAETVYKLPPQLYELLVIMQDGRERTVLELVRGVWGYRKIRATDSRILRVLISQLRKRIGENRIVTTKGGYKLVI
jgi:DNA-binding response OmpR family regulator